MGPVVIKFNKKDTINEHASSTFKRWQKMICAFSKVKSRKNIIHSQWNKRNSQDVYCEDFVKSKSGHFQAKTEWGECLKKEEEKTYSELTWTLILSGANGVFYVSKACLL